MTVYTLPLPISTNELYYNKAEGGRGKTRRYKAWVHDAAMILLCQRARPVAGPVRVSIEVSEKSRCDIDNAAKCVLDALVARGVIEDDRKKFIRGVSLEWSSEVDGMRVTIKPAEAV
jgi:Holliday junction resolvase RusA-like endonuclease